MARKDTTKAGNSDLNTQEEQPKKCFIAYYRVSTDRQGRSGLGLEAQQAAVSNYVNGHGQLVAEYTEVETGKRSDRAQLSRALAHTRKLKGTLVIAKLDRLSRNVLFTSQLMEAGTNFVACDMPNANPLTIHILAAVAEDEARRISTRTKEALAAYKARGGLLGAARPECREISREAGRKGSRIGAAKMVAKARAAYADIIPLLQQLRKEGKSLREIATHLNAVGYLTTTGHSWHPTQVKRVLDRSTY